MPNLRITDSENRLVFETDMINFWSLENGADEDGPHINFHELIKLPGDEDPEYTTEVIEYAINEGLGGRLPATETFCIAYDRENRQTGFMWSDEVGEALKMDYTFTYNPDGDL